MRGSERRRSARKGPAGRDRPDLREVPRWRQIEIMKERQALRDMLDDFGDDEIDLDEDVFGFDECGDDYFRDAEDPEEEPEGPEEDDFLDDDFEDD